MLQHALVEYDIWQKNLFAEVHSAALATSDDRTSEDRKNYGPRLTQEQNKVLTNSFARCKKPSTGTKQDLAKKFGVTYGKIDVSDVFLSARSCSE